MMDSLCGRTPLEGKRCAKGDGLMAAMHHRQNHPGKKSGALAIGAFGRRGASDMAVQNPDPPGGKPWRVVTRRFAKSEAPPSWLVARARKMVRNGLAGTRKLPTRNEAAWDTPTITLNQICSADLTRAALKTEPEETGHFWKTPDEMSGTWRFADL